MADGDGGAVDIDLRGVEQVPAVALVLLIDVPRVPFAGRVTKELQHTGGESLGDEFPIGALILDRDEDTPAVDLDAQ